MTPSVSSTVALSVISSTRAPGSQARLPRAVGDPVDEAGVLELAGRHVDGHGQGTADGARHSWACWQAWSSTQRADRDDQPVCSARSMNSLGPSRPRPGCCQRTQRLEAPDARPESMSMTGW